MRNGLFFVVFIFSVLVSFAQPYVDVLNVRTLQSPDNGFIRRNKDKN
ncbi:MAG: hypothetical protein IPK31_06360 [Chitinophagaceae bacterium]|nr:hypothetical protein [Chitinophagaceae bacterium]